MRLVLESQKPITVDIRNASNGALQVIYFLDGFQQTEFLEEDSEGLDFYDSSGVAVAKLRFFR